MRQVITTNLSWLRFQAFRKEWDSFSKASVKMIRHVKDKPGNFRVREIKYLTKGQPV